MQKSKPPERQAGRSFYLVLQLVLDRLCKSVVVLSTLIYLYLKIKLQIQAKASVALSSKWLGKQPFKLRIRVRLPLALIFSSL